jgi:hypothetical protein
MCSIRHTFSDLLEYRRPGNIQFKEMFIGSMFPLFIHELVFIDMITGGEISLLIYGKNYFL